MAIVKLYEIAHARSGDKGDTSNISLIPDDENNYLLLKEKITPEVVKKHFGAVAQGEIIRYELPQISSLNFVLNNALCGGVTSSLALDTHGKSMSSVLLNLEIYVD